MTARNRIIGIVALVCCIFTTATLEGQEINPTTWIDPEANPGKFEPLNLIYGLQHHRITRIFRFTHPALGPKVR